VLRDPARHLLRVLAGIAEEAEHRHRVEVARLFLQLREVDRATVDARRCAGLQPTLGSLSSFRRADSAIAGGSPARPALWLSRPTWICRRGRYQPSAPRSEPKSEHPLAFERLPHGHLQATSPSQAPWNNHRFGWVFEALANRCLVQNTIGLRPRARARPAPSTRSGCGTGCRPRRSPPPSRRPARRSP